MAGATTLHNSKTGKNCLEAKNGQHPKDDNAEFIQVVPLGYCTEHTFHFQRQIMYPLAKKTKTSAMEKDKRLCSE